MTTVSSRGSATACVALVAIGRNEGDRLRTCLRSVQQNGLVGLVVYVDSGSTDGSADFARNLGCQVVDLDMRLPFTAARARNEGFALALKCLPELTHVQFVDGDCELVAGWLPAALQFLVEHEQVAIVCGRRRERYPQRSVFNKLCDAEWNTPVGKARSCGGDALMRVDAFRAAAGYRNDLIAGEEPELCVRLREVGWEIWRLDHEMTLHDAAMLHFSQWWNRSKRAGYAFAEGAFLHGSAPECHRVREVRRALAWGVLLPVVIVIASVLQPFGFALVLIYPFLVIRLVLKDGASGAFAWWRALFLMLSKFPESQGVLRFWWNKLRGRAGTLIEYK